MPATYAHWQFGSKCIEKMPKKIQKLVRENRDLFNLAVHGPDFLFYDLLHSDLRNLGTKKHKEPVKYFFKNAKTIIKKHKQKEKEKMLVYLIGFLTHFTLDSNCHSYIERKAEVSKLEHSKVESEWDRHLIENDGLQANLLDRSQTLKPTKDNTEIISHLYGLSPKQTYNAFFKHKLVTKALNCKSKKKYKAIQYACKKINKPFYEGLIIGFDECELCMDSNLRLDKLSSKALKQYPKLLTNLIDYLQDKKNLSKYFDNHFDERNDYKKLKVLTYKKELTYVVR